MTITPAPDHGPEASPRPLLPLAPTFDGWPLLTAGAYPRDARVVLHLAEAALVHIDGYEALAYFDAAGLTPPSDWLLAAGTHPCAINGGAVLARAIALARARRNSGQLRALGAALAEQVPGAGIDAYLADGARDDAVRVVAHATVQAVDRGDLLKRVGIVASPELLADIGAIVDRARAELADILRAQPVIQERRNLQDPYTAASDAETVRRHVARVAASLYDLEGDDLVARALDEPAAADDREALLLRVHALISSQQFAEALRTLVSLNNIPALIALGEALFVHHRSWSQRFFAAAEALRDASH